jgi:DNA-binding transcriptional LysR family regulator
MYAILWAIAIGVSLFRSRHAQIIHNGRLVEIMPKWRFRTQGLSLVHLRNRNMPRPVRLFNEFAGRMAPTLFPNLPA